MRMIRIGDCGEQGLIVLGYRGSGLIGLWGSVRDCNSSELSQVLGVLSYE